MSDVLAIISKAVFEETGKGKAPGDLLPLDRYVSKNPGLAPLEEGGRLFLVTVRPPNEALWLVAVLERPKHDGERWKAAANTRPIRDISGLRSKIKFTSGAGISAKAGALGMSLQTPRVLAESDVALLLGDSANSAPSKPAPSKPAPSKPAPSKPAPSKPAPSKPAPSKPAPPKAAPPVAGARPSNEPSSIAGALGAAHYDVALSALLTDWSKSRAPELAALIDRVDALLPAAAGKDFKAALRASRSAGARALLADLCKGVRFAEALARIEAVAEAAPDPRISEALVAFLIEPPFTAQSSRGFWNALFDALEARHADPRAIAKLSDVAPRYLQIFGATVMGEAIQKRIQKLIPKLEQRFADARTADPAELAELAALLPKEAAARASGKASSVEALVAAVWADPDNEEPYLVLADLLQEKGDPRGEFMGLSLRSARGESLSEDETKRMQKLVDKHHKAWFPQLYDATYAKDTTFHRGFPRSVHLRLLGGKLGAASNHPSWSTVRELDVHTGGTKEHGANLLIQPVMRRLRALRGVLYDVVQALAEHGAEHQLEELEIEWLPFREDPERGEHWDDAEARFFHPAWDALITGRALPKLRALTIHPEHVYPETLASFWTSPLAARLESLKLRTQYGFAPQLVLDARRLAPPKLDVHVLGHESAVYLAHGGAITVQAFAEQSKGRREGPLAAVRRQLPPTLEGVITALGFSASDLKGLAKHLPKAEVRAG